MEKPSCESTPPSQDYALCQQQGPAVALCPVVKLSAVLIAFNPKLYVAPSDSVSNATFHYFCSRQPVETRKMDMRVKGRFGAFLHLVHSNQVMCLEIWSVTLIVWFLFTRRKIQANRKASLQTI